MRQVEITEEMLEAFRLCWEAKDQAQEKLGKAEPGARRRAGIQAVLSIVGASHDLYVARPGTALVTLFKASGRYYTVDEWRIPTEVPDFSEQRGHYTREVLVPSDMRYSPDFRRIDGGAVLVQSQEPWGYPHLFPTEDKS